MNDDQRLIKRIADDDKQALEEIYHKYYADVYRFAYVVTKQTETAEDVAQSVFLQISRYAGQYRPSGSVKAWIIQITRSISLNVMKHDALIKRVEYDELTEIPGVDVFNDIDFLSSLEGLPSESREIVILHVTYRFKHHEIATMLGKTPSAVRQQYKRALDFLRKGYRYKDAAAKGDDSCDEA